MTAGAAIAGFVSGGIAAAGTVAWLVTPSEAPQPLAARFDAASPMDPARLGAGAEPVALEQGRIYYVQLCLPCHGARGDGTGEWAYRVTPRPADLTSARARGRTDAQLFTLISEPQPGTPMIGWKGQLSESQRSQLVGYVRHLSQRGATGASR